MLSWSVVFCRISSIYFVLTPECEKSRFILLSVSVYTAIVIFFRVFANCCVSIRHSDSFHSPSFPLSNLANVPSATLESTF